ncbi:ATP-binding protein [Arenibacter amylolyticus]|uniref:ATP-binding protein n=1 Tax=Arenibacter amylolyticus TaxID=1406873 RepID=UPI000A3B879F|nr:ATP-binding protein [Arenibacter amylolyticus]
MPRAVFPLRPKPSFATIKKSITRSFAIIFAGTLLLILGFYIALNQRGYDVKIINLAGQQRMMSQKVLKGIYATQVSESHLPKLKQDAATWHQMHQSLEKKESHLEAAVLSKEMDSIFKAITPYHQQLYEIAKKADIAALTNEELQQVDVLGHRYVLGIDALVAMLEKELALELSRFKYIIILLTGVFILLIWILYRFYVKDIIDAVRLLSKEKDLQYQHLHAIMESTKNQIWTMDREYRLIFHNSAFVHHRSKFYQNAPKIGENILDFPYDTKKPQHIKDYYDRALSGEYFSIETKMELDSETYYYELTFIPIRDKRNAITGCSVYQNDITQRVITLYKLQESKNSLLEAQKIANIGSWDWDLTNDKIKWSQQLYTIMGKDATSFNPSYKTLLSQIHEEDRKDFKKTLCSSLDEDGAFSLSNRILLDDGSTRYMRHMGKAYFNENNALVRVSGTTQDLTLLEKSQQQIIRQYRELQNFVYIVSHNVRGPITTILSLLQLYEDSSSEKKEDIIQMIHQTVNKLDGTIKDLNHSLSLKNFSQSELERIELKKIIEDVLILISSEIERTKAKIDLNIGPSVHVYGLKSYFTNIFYNLIINSLKYKSRERPLNVSINATPNSLGGTEITILDNGAGMDLNDERRKKIFDMYGRLSGTASGKGLGLYLVKVQVEAMNGSIEVESTLNKGTTFTLHLPSYS